MQVAGVKGMRLLACLPGTIGALSPEFLPLLEAVQKFVRCEGHGNVGLPTWCVWWPATDLSWHAVLPLCEAFAAQLSF